MLFLHLGGASEHRFLTAVFMAHAVVPFSMRERSLVKYKV